METLTGHVTAIVFQNKENGWSVITLEPAKDCHVAAENVSASGKVSAVGVMPTVRKGMSVSLDGDWTDSKYGRQLKVTAMQEVMPDELDGIERYLASGLVKEIGPVYAKAIVSHFGKDTLRVMDEEPERLCEVKGIGKKRLESIIASARSQKAIRSIMVWLKKHDLPNGISVKLYEAYGDETIHTLQTNPYVLVDDIDGVAFLKADDVARRLGMPEESPLRIRSGIMQCLKDYCEKGGHTYVPEETLLKAASSSAYLSLPAEKVTPVLESLKAEGKDLVCEEDRISLPLYRACEAGCAKRIMHILSTTRGMEPIPFDLDAIQAKSGVVYDPVQVEALQCAMEERIVVITGGPGTGKTITTNAIILAAETAGKRVFLAAPTGRAAKRMSEVSGREAKTIHRLLGYQQGGFTYGEDCPLSGDMLIIDETSMVDVVLMNSLLKAIPDGMRLVLVGDVDQLPSVGCGCVLKDIIQSECIPTVRLKTIFRQAQDSGIIMNAHRINAGQEPDYGIAPDFLFAPCEGTAEIAEKIIRLVTEELPERYGFAVGDIQVLSPMRREFDPIGTTRLNAALRDIINPSRGTDAGRFRVGDKVMQMKNDYDKNVFNGDIGYVRDIDPEEGLVVEMNGECVFYEKGEAGELELAYATTVHKSQGSEYKAVVIPVHKSHYVLLKRNLLYTAVTRAKSLCVLVGDREAAAMAARIPDGAKRFTWLDRRINDEKEILERSGEGLLF